MTIDWTRALPGVALGGILGAPLGPALSASLGHEMVALGAINAAGWFGLGLISGRWGARMSGFRALLATFGVAAFSSWGTLALHGSDTTAAFLIAFIEVVFGFLLAVVGHLVTMSKGRDL